MSQQPTERLHIRPLVRDDRAQWQSLWQGYLRFYRHRVPLELTNGTFARLTDPQSPLYALVAEREGQLLGFVHYLFHASTWTTGQVCYLEDLFTAPAARGQGAGRALIQAVYAAADAAGATTVYWMTQEFNADARGLYDTLARRTSFIRYER